MATVDGQKVKVGDYVSFKADYDQCGRISKIVGTRLVIEVSENDPEFHETYTESASRCWIEG